MPENKIYKLSDFNFQLPEELIAQYPVQNRDESRLFVLDRKTGVFGHRVFREIIDYLMAGDVLVMNNARVIPARIFFNRESGGRVEVILANRISETRWLIISNRSKRLKCGETLVYSGDESIRVKIIKRIDDCFEIESSVPFDEMVLKRVGSVPLPPYIKRDFSSLDEERYQTIYAKHPGSAAAPTAGLHFSGALIQDIIKKGIEIAYLTLDVSWGTFQPVRNENLGTHKMHKEKYNLPDGAASIINKARMEKRRIISVGTTALRVLESTYENGLNRPGAGETEIFIHPPKHVHSIDALITNFHTPCSTLLMLVSAFAGYQLTMNAYNEAINMKYRFFSYGDAMLIL